MRELVIAIITSAVYIVLLAKVLKVRKGQDAMAVIPCRPSTLLLVTTGLRYVCGGWIVMVMGWLFGVPGGEYGQYKVTFEHGLFSLTVWSVSLCVAIISYAIVGVGFKEKRISDEIVMSKGWLERASSIDKIELVFLTSLLLKIVYVIVSSIIGSEDRGESYTYWALIDWKPTAALIAINRLFDLCYVLTPIVISKEYSLVKRAGYISGIGLTICLMMLWGGRGEVLYPVIYIGLGTFAILRKRDLAKLAIILMAICAISLPTMSALRDMPEYGSLSGTQRLALLGRLFDDGSSLKRRVQTIGRDIYACSDGYIYKEGKRKSAGAGIDIDMGKIMKHGIPRILGGSEKKSDGSTLAQGYMNSDVKDWYPCITFPGDMFRRFKWVGVVVGSSVCGFVVLVADRIWQSLRYARGTWALILVLLPVTLLRTAPTGTLKEVTGIYPWELVKYAVICALVGYAIEMITSRRVQ